MIDLAELLVLSLLFIGGTIGYILDLKMIYDSGGKNDR